MTQVHKKNKPLSEEDEKKALSVYQESFDYKSTRVFYACPPGLSENNKIIKDNHETLSVCNKYTSNDNGNILLIHYYDYAENCLKQRANNGTTIFPMQNYWLVKGWIYEEKTSRLLARAFPYSPKVSITRIEFARKLATQRENPKLRLRQYLEGIVAKIFTFNDKVFISATRRIEALSSRRDGQLSNEEHLKECNIDINKLKSDNGLVYVVLLVHPKNQIQNPNPVQTKIYHLDTWGPEKENGKRHHSNNNGHTVNKNANRTLVRYDNVDLKKFNIHKLPQLSEIEALEAFDRNEIIYMQEEDEEACVYFSEVVKHRLQVRGDKEHLYHQYVTLDEVIRPELKQCVPKAMKEEVATFREKLNNDMRQIVSFVINSFIASDINNHGLEDTSLYALYLHCKHLPSFVAAEKEVEIMEKEVIEVLKSIKGNLLYNLFSTYRTKIEKKRLKSGSTSSCGISPCPSVANLDI